MSRHTTVAEVKGSATAAVIVDRLRRDIPQGRIGLAVVLPHDSKVVDTDKEDTEGSIDLPRKRPVVAAVAFGALFGVAGLFVVRAVTNHWTGAIISAVFLFIVGAVVGALFGGAGRFAGDRAWEQERQGDQAICLLAVCSDDEAGATQAAAAIEELGLVDVRIVGKDGGWHLPNT